MAKRCISCNKVFGDEVLYCPECGKKLEDQKAMQDATQKPTGVSGRGSFDFQALLHVLLYDYGLVFAAVLGLIFTWDVSCVIGMMVSGAVLIVLYFEKEIAQPFKATGVAKVLAIINVIFSAIILFI